MKKHTYYRYDEVSDKVVSKRFRSGALVRCGKGVWHNTRTAALLAAKGNYADAVLYLSEYEVM